MLYQVEGRIVYCDTGAQEFDAALPTAVLIHGAQNDHSVWAGQSRHLAQHGFNVLALDLPGHGRSKGEARNSIGAMAAWLLALLDAAGLARAALIGHSMGALIALEAASMAPARVSHLALLGACFPMPVAPALLSAAMLDEAKAIDMINHWSHSPAGLHLMDDAKALMQRIAAINPQHVLHTDLFACNAYANGLLAAASVACPALLLVGTRDKMAPARSATLLTAAIRQAGVVQIESGHALMMEQPDLVFDALLGFVT